MGSLILALINPIYLGIFALLLAFSFILPASSSLSFLAALSPFLVLLVSISFLTKISTPLKLTGNSLKILLIGIVLIYLLKDPTYFQSIALASQAEINISAALSGLVYILSQSSIIIILVSSLLLLSEIGFRFIAADQDWIVVLENFRAIFLLGFIALSASIILSLSIGFAS